MFTTNPAGFKTISEVRASHSSEAVAEPALTPKIRAIVELVRCRRNPHGSLPRWAVEELLQQLLSLRAESEKVDDIQVATRLLVLRAQIEMPTIIGRDGELASALVSNLPPLSGFDEPLS